MKTTYINPPIPIRCFDWTCVGDDYEPGDPQGFGATEKDAIKDYLDQVASNHAQIQQTQTPPTYSA